MVVVVNISNYKSTYCTEDMTIADHLAEIDQFRVIKAEQLSLDLATTCNTMIGSVIGISCEVKISFTIIARCCCLQRAEPF